MKKNRQPRLTEDGIPRDAKDWEVEDWRDLYVAITTAKGKIATRHDHEREAEATEACDR